MRGQTKLSGKEGEELGSRGTARPLATAKKIGVYLEIHDKLVQEYGQQ